MLNKSTITISRPQGKTAEANDLVHINGVALLLAIVIFAVGIIGVAILDFYRVSDTWITKT